MMLSVQSVEHALVCWIAVLIWSVQNANARGPHHPHSEVDKRRNSVVDEHLAHGNKHMQDELEHSNIVFTKPVSEMSDEEKSFYYFKLHDMDHNDALDGLELIQAAMHQSHDHNHDQNEVPNENHNADIDGADQWAHVIAVIDDFIAHADIDLDGYLNFVEYTSAIRYKEQLLSESNDGNEVDIEGNNAL